MTVSGGPAWYEIRVAGVLHSRRAAWFDGLQVSGHRDETVIFGLLADQSALHGLLAKVRDLGLTLIAVRRLDPAAAKGTLRDRDLHNRAARSQSPLANMRIDGRNYALEPARTRGFGAPPPKNNAGGSGHLLKRPGHRRRAS